MSKSNTAQRAVFIGKPTSNQSTLSSPAHPNRQTTYRNIQHQLPEDLYFRWQPSSMLGLQWHRENFRLANASMGSPRHQEGDA